MGRYVGSYQRIGLADLPIVSDATFTEGINLTDRFVAPAIVDTGADFSSIPTDFVQKYNLPVLDWKLVLQMDGTRKKRPIYFLRVEVIGLRGITERFIDCGYPDILLGVNVLNRWRIILDPSHKVQQYDFIIDD
jgi:predicted aspartyl protease